MYPAWRHRVLRVSADVRCVMLAVLAVGLARHAGSLPLLAVFAAAVVAGLPFFPALAAGLPQAVEDADRSRMTSWLAVAETVAWTAGPPVGALLLILLGSAGAATAAAGLVLAGRVVLPRVDLGGGVVGRQESYRICDGIRTLRRSRLLCHALVGAVAVNVVSGIIIVVLPDLADHQAGGRFGVLALAFGAGALLAPLLARRAWPVPLLGSPIRSR